jgi:hypothetical protein
VGFAVSRVSSASKNCREAFNEDSRPRTLVSAKHLEFESTLEAKVEGKVFILFQSDNLFYYSFLEVLHIAVPEDASLLEGQL